MQTSREPLLLTGPYGYGQGEHISLRGRPTDTTMLILTLVEYSCHVPAIPKIVRCLLISRRYDCVVRASWFNSQRRELARALAQINVSLLIECDGIWVPSAKKPR